MAVLGFSCWEAVVTLVSNWLLEKFVQFCEPFFPGGPSSMVYQAMVWLMYGVKVCGSTAGPGKPAASTRPVWVAPATGSRVVSNPAARSSDTSTGAAAVAQGSL